MLKIFVLIMTITITALKITSAPASSATPAEKRPIGDLSDRRVLTFVFEDKDNFPFELGEGSALATPHPGISIDILRMVGEKLNLQIDFRRSPWKRALEIELQNGNIDGLFSASYVKEREAFGIYPLIGQTPDEGKRLYTSSYVFYQAKGNNISWDGNTLDFRETIYVPVGYSIADDLRKKGLKVAENNSPQQLMQQLALKRIKIAALLEDSGDFVMSSRPDIGKSVEKLSPPIKTKAYYVLFSHQFYAKNEGLALRIWDTIENIRMKEQSNLSKKYLQSK
ncbi:MAG: transporter substrate-binding domain-containing protein [Oligoflexia bacterium]|nr:transporter substrate-binding domain-containing protein [Oligoflexia bacterium]